MNLPNEIRLIRQQALLTQETFAKELGVAFSTVNRWESGRAHPNMTGMNRLKQFCDSRQLSFDELQTAWLSEENALSREKKLS